MKFIPLDGVKTNDEFYYFHIRPEQIIVVESALNDEEWVDRNFPHDDGDVMLWNAIVKGDDYGRAKLTLANGSTMFVGRSVNEILELLNSDHE